MNFGFEPYPFEKLRALMADVVAPEKTISLTIGEPQFPTPAFILDVVRKEAPLFSRYPASAGLPELKAAQIGFMQRRFGVGLDESELLPTMGTREALFNLPQYLLFGRPHPVMAWPNPAYQIYEGAAKASRAEPVMLELTAENGFKPDITDARLKRCDLVIINSPNNPTGSVLSLEEMKAWVLKAIEHDFVLINDECYSEIYEGHPPASLLQAAVAVGNDRFKNVLVMNSLSKRSSAAGIRSGFVAGDRTLLEGYRLYRTYAGCVAGLPLQMAAAAAWQDETHAESIRALYAQNIKTARSLLDIRIPEATFYLWPAVRDDQQAARTLLSRHGLAVLPGSFLGREGAGRGYLRLSLVQEPQQCEVALKRFSEFLKGEA